MQFTLALYNHIQIAGGLLAGAIYLLSFAWERRLTQDEKDQIIYRS